MKPLKYPLGRNTQEKLIWLQQFHFKDYLYYILILGLKRYLCTFISVLSLLWWQFSVFLFGLDKTCFSHPLHAHSYYRLGYTPVLKMMIVHFTWTRRGVNRRVAAGPHNDACGWVVYVFAGPTCGLRWTWQSPSSATQRVGSLSNRIGGLRWGTIARRNSATWWGFSMNSMVASENLWWKSMKIHDENLWKSITCTFLFNW